MASFTLRFDLTGFDLERRDNVPILIEPLTMPYPSSISGTTYIDIPALRTGTDGKVQTELASEPGLQYRVESWALGTRVIPGDWPDGTVLDWHNVAEAEPAPIEPVDAAALRASLQAMLTAALADLGTGVHLWEVGQEEPTRPTPVGTIIYRKV